MTYALNADNFRELATQFNQLKQQINSIQPPEYFKERVYLKYYQLVINQLDVIFNNPFDDQTTVLALQNFFTENLKYIKVNLLTPTAINDSETTRFLCKIIPLICGDKNPLNILFGDELNCDSNLDKYPTLDASIPLERILKTHIISDDGICLIPLRCITEPLILEDFYQPDKALIKHYSPYHPEYKELTRNEIQRLIDHSKVTEELNAAIELSHKLKTEKSSDLYSNLDRMCRLLRIQDAYGGRGVQTQTGEGTFIALTQFIKYYDKLSDAKKATIPTRVKGAIDHLLNVSSDYKGNMATVIETCSADRRTEIVNAMQGQEHVLAMICIDEDKTQKQKEDALAIQNKHINDLTQSLDNNTYNNGSDKLGFNNQLLQKLQIECHINRPRDLEYFKKLKPTEMKDLLLNNHYLQQELITTLATLENFIFFTHELSRDGLEALLEVMAETIRATFVGDVADFYALLMTHNDSDTFSLLFKTFNRNGYPIRSDLLSKEQLELLTQLHFKQYEYLNNYTPEELTEKLRTHEINLIDLYNKLSSKELFISFTLQFNLDVIKIIEANSTSASFFHSRNNYHQNDFYDLIKVHNDLDKFAYFVNKYDRHQFEYEEENISDEQATLLRQIKYSHLEYLIEQSPEEFKKELTNPLVREQISSTFKNISYLMAFIKDFTPEKLNLLFNVLGNQLPRFNTVPYSKDLTNFCKLNDNEEKLKFILDLFGYRDALSNLCYLPFVYPTPELLQAHDLDVQTYEKLFSVYFENENVGITLPDRSRILSHVLMDGSGLSLNGITALINLGAEINPQNTNEPSPLERALAYNRSPAIVKFLIAKGANRFIPEIFVYSLQNWRNTLTYFETCFINRESFADAFQHSHFTDPIEHYRIALSHQHDQPFGTNRDAITPEISMFLNSIQFDTLFIELVKTKRAYDFQRAKHSLFAANDRRSEALNDLLMELVQLRSELIATEHQYTPQIRDEFITNCLNALDRARPELEKFHLTKTIIGKFIACLLIVPIVIMYLLGNLPWKSNSLNQVEKLESNLLRFSYFNPVPLVEPQDAPAEVFAPT